MDSIASVRETKEENHVKGNLTMTKKINEGSQNQNSPRLQHEMAEFSQELLTSGDNSKGNKRNKDQKDKTD